MYIAYKWHLIKINGNTHTYKHTSKNSYIKIIARFNKKRV